MVGLGPGLGGMCNLIGSPFAGVLIDRLNRRTILMLSETIMGLSIMALGFLIVAGVLELWHIFVVSMIQGTMNGFLSPTRNTLMYDVVDRKSLVNAMAGQQMANNISSIAGPLAAGFIMNAYGPGPLFLIIGTIILLGTSLLMGVKGVKSTARKAKSFWLDFKDGVGFAVHDRPVRTVLWTVLITETLGFSSWTMYPVITRNVLDSGPIVLGLLSAVRGIGGMVGALSISSLGEIRIKGWALMVSTFTFGLFILLFAWSSNLPLSLMILFIVGISGSIYDVLVFSLLQTLAPDEMRGRIMGFQTFLVSGVFLGSMVMGAVASWLTVKWAVGAGGAVVSVNALNIWPNANAISERSFNPNSTSTKNDGG